MVKSKVVDLLKMRLGNRTDADIDARIDAELDMAQFQLENHGDFTPWFLLSETSVYTTTAGEARIPLPSDFISEYEEGALFYGTTPLEKYDYDAMVEAFAGASGPPQGYALVDDTFVLFPTPNGAYSVQMKYYQSQTAPSALASDEENVWLKWAADWLMATAGYPLARFIKDTEAAQMFLTDAQTAGARVYKVHVDRAERNVSRQMGDN